MNLGIISVGKYHLISMKHEMQLNIIFSMHDRGSENKCHDPSPGYGYRDPKSKFRDIMAYNCAPNQCDNNSGQACSRIQRFSNNYAKYNDAPVGDTRHNCAHLIDSRKSIIAGYFPAKTDAEIASLAASEEETDIRAPRSGFENCRKRGRCVQDSACCSNKCRNTRCIVSLDAPEEETSIDTPRSGFENCRERGRCVEDSTCCSGKCKNTRCVVG